MQQLNNFYQLPAVRIVFWPKEMKYKCKMFRALLAFGIVGLACLYASVVDGQPTECAMDSQCSDGKGYYCDRDVFRCRKCLSCEDLKREPPLSPSSCIKSVIECGACIKGLMEDMGGDVNSQCVAAAGGAGEGGPPAYVWAAVALGLLLLALVVLIIVYVLRNTYTFKILASTRTSVQSPCSGGTSNGGGGGGGGGVVASAAEPPPPYDASAPYEPLPERPASPPDPAYTAGDTHPAATDDESSWPFMKRASPERGAAGGAREAAARQAARVYSYPRYVRPPHAPHAPSAPQGYEIPAMNEESESTFTVHDEDTMESQWTPTPSVDHTDTNGNVPGSTAVGTVGTPHAPHAAAAPHAPHTAHAPHAPHSAHALCARQDTNNNRNTSEPTVSSGPSFFINVVQNINAVQQHNDVTL